MKENQAVCRVLYNNAWN